MQIHLGTGETVAIPIDEILRVVFSQTTGVQDPAGAEHTPLAFRQMR
jgi:hypothetical protein